MQSEFEVALRTVTPATADDLRNAFDLVSAEANGATLEAGPNYSEVLQRLLSAGFAETAAAFFLASIRVMGELNFTSLTDSMPNTVCIDKWIKASKLQRRLILSKIMHEHDRFYPTAWGDWYVKGAPIKKLAPFALVALQPLDRPDYLPDSVSLLGAILSRDRKFILADTLTRAVLDREGAIRRLLQACVLVPGVGENYARTFGRAIAGGVGRTNPLLKVLTELTRERDRTLSEFSGRFAAHVATTWGLTVDRKNVFSHDDEEALLSFGSDIYLLSHASRDRDLWFASRTGRLREQLLQEQGKVSVHGALQIALGLRSAETSADAKDALWSTAFNLGLREIGKTGEVESFDPLLHEDLRGGLIREDKARIVHCGWMFKDTVLLRAQVEAV